MEILKKYFPDWKERIEYQQKQEKFYESVIRKTRELKKLRIEESSKFYSQEELDAFDYFQGT
jgi:hypothetical protein